jgi:Tetratricopeptide repeat
MRHGCWTGPGPTCETTPGVRREGPAERAVAIDEAVYGSGHPAVATCLNVLAAILRDQSQPEAARPLQERALANDKAAQPTRSRLAGGGARQMTAPKNAVYAHGR